MFSSALQFPLVKLFNRVLADYPLARERLQSHAGKTVAAAVGPFDVLTRVSSYGEMEMVGAGVVDNATQAETPTEGETPAPADVSLQIPLALLPRLARGDESAFSEVMFSGDSEFAATISMVARNVEWDIEEDLSRVVGDIAAHRLVSTIKSLRSWGSDANTRLMENIGEYLTEERRSFISARELEDIALANETLRDALARLGARLDNINKSAGPA